MQAETTLPLLLLANAILAASGLPALAGSRRSDLGQRLANGLVVAGCAVGLAGALAGLTGAGGPVRHLGVPGIGSGIALGLDALSAFFLVPIYLVGGLASIYGLGYWRQSEHPGNGRKLRFFYGLEVAALAQLVLARDGLSFLVTWEVMALAAYFLITTEAHDRETLSAGWIYLVYTHLGTLALIAAFALLAEAGGGFLLPPGGLAASGGVATAIFVLALVGFGIKAGLMPLHSWLPGAHASAPSHVSALLSGVLIKMGIYGLLRVTSLFAEPPFAWGGAVLCLGIVSSLLGVAFALGQHDLKRLLAYHSIENVGIIALGLGLALLGRSAGEPAWVALGLGGCLLHVWNHALFKPLLFFGAGAVIHGVGTREIDRTGGLARAMPVTAALFAVGAIAICGLPPLNGFASELLIYLGLFRTALSPGELHWAAGMLGIPVLAMVGGLALACFVKVFGVVFLGEPRSQACRGACDPPGSMAFPMGLLAAGCVAIGAAPWAVAPALEATLAAWAPGAPEAAVRLVEVAPLSALTPVALALLGLSALVALPLARAALRRRIERGRPTWSCGYAGASPRMQYTGTSFAQMLVGLFGWALAPRVHRPRLSGIFPGPERFEVHVEDPALSRLLAWSERIERACLGLRFLQHGPVQRQILYVVGAVAALLLLSLAAQGCAG